MAQLKEPLIMFVTSDCVLAPNMELAGKLLELNLKSLAFMECAEKLKVNTRTNTDNSLKQEFKKNFCLKQQILFDKYFIIHSANNFLTFLKHILFSKESLSQYSYNLLITNIHIKP